MISTTGIRGDGPNPFALLALSIVLFAALAGCPSEDDGKCEDQSDCLLGELCIDSRCSRPALGSQCTWDEDCSSLGEGGAGAVCEGGRCAAACGEDGSCPGGKVCSAQAGTWRASCIPVCDGFGACPDERDVCTSLPSGGKGCVRKGQALSACVDVTNLNWCGVEPIAFVCGNDEWIDTCWEYENGGTNYCPGYSRLEQCSWDQMSCRCPEGSVAVDCWNREPCSPNCFSNYGTAWGCQSYTEFEPSALCDTPLDWLSGVCLCRDGASVSFDCSFRAYGTCEEACEDRR